MILISNTLLVQHQMGSEKGKNGIDSHEDFLYLRGKIQTITFSSSASDDASNDQPLTPRNKKPAYELIYEARRDALQLGTVGMDAVPTIATDSSGLQELSLKVIILIAVAVGL